MRITHNILISNFLRNLNSISERIERSQQQLASGKKFSRPNQAPVEVAQVIGFQSSISKMSQYMKNIDDGSSQVGYVDTVLQSVINDIGRARDLAEDGANDNLNLADRQAIAKEVNLIVETTLGNANSRFRDRFTFAGWQTRTEPFEAVVNPRTGYIDDVIYKGNRGRIDRLVGDGDQLAINVSGKDLFLYQTYTLKGKPLPLDKPLGFDGTLTINGIDLLVTPEMTLRDIQLNLEALNTRTHVFATISEGRLVLESASAVSEFTVSDNCEDILLEDLGLKVSGAFNHAVAAPTLPLVDSTPVIFIGAGPVANLSYNDTNNLINISLGADANNGTSVSANIFITPKTYASVADLIIEMQKQIDAQFGAGKIRVSDAGGGVLQIETVATGDDVDFGDLVIGGSYNGYPDNASDSADLNLIAVVGNAPATPAGIAGVDGNDKIVIDLGPTASKTGTDVLPQTIDLRAAMTTTPDALVDEINYQIFRNDALRGAVRARLSQGRLMIETVKEGQDILAADLQISEGATGTLAALGISDVVTPAQYIGTPLVFPFIVVAGFNDTITVDLGPTVSMDGTDPPPVTLTIDAGICNNITEVFNEINSKIQGEPDLNGAIQAVIQGPPGGEYLVLLSRNTGSGVRGEDMSVGGPLAGTLGWLGATAIPGGGTSNGRGIEVQPSNIFSTLITIRDDLMGVVSPQTKVIDALTGTFEQLGLVDGDIVTVSYDAGTFSFKLTATDTMTDLARYIEAIFGTRALVRVSSDGRIEIQNQETAQILGLSIKVASVTGEPRTVFNGVLGGIPAVVPGLSSVVSNPLYSSQRYLRLGDEDLGLVDNDLENILSHEAIVGARANRMSTVLNLFTAVDLNVRELKNSVEASNYAEVLTLLSQQELVLQSALGVGARVLTPTLLDFLA